MAKLQWVGEVISVQPRIRLTRSFDQRSHTYLGYALTIRGAIACESREFSVGIGRAAQDKHRFEVGHVVSGVTEPVADPNLEAVEFYKASALRVEETRSSSSSSPPWLGVPPTLETYRARGHRRLAAKTYETQCVSCVWAAECRWN